jgi:CopG family transcriptional regulator/antitoxin EndoAI
MNTTGYIMIYIIYDYLNSFQRMPVYANYDKNFRYFNFIRYQIKELGGLFLSELRKILISLPDNLLKEVDSIVSVEKINRSEFVREAMKLYIREKRKIEMRDKMKKGYQEMAEINARLAEMCFDADNEQQQKYEERLGELER